MDRLLGTPVLEESFQRARLAGAEGIEVCYSAPYGAKLVAQDEHKDELLKFARKFNLEIPSLCLSFLCDSPSLIGQPSNITSARRQVEAALELASAVGAKVVLLPFFGKNLIQIEEEINVAIAALTPLVEAAEEAAVILGIESTLNITQTKFLLNSLGDSEFVRSYFDVGNSLAHKIDPASGLRELGRAAVAQVHFKDVHLAEGKAPDFKISLGGGSINFRACVQALRAIGYDAWIVLETPALDDPIGSAKANLEYVRTLLC